MKKIKIWMGAFGFPKSTEGGRRSAIRMRGFTLAELLVVVAVISILSVAVTVNFRRGEKIQRLNVAADSVQSSLRQMQGNILSGLEYGPGQSAKDFGFEMSENGQSYTAFVEDNSPISNRTDLETVRLPSGVTAVDLSVGVESASKIEVRFFPPFGRIKITGTGTSYDLEENINAAFGLRLDTGGGSIITKQVEVDGLTGRIEIK